MRAGLRQSSRLSRKHSEVPVTRRFESRTLSRASGVPRLDLRQGADSLAQSRLRFGSFIPPHTPPDENPILALEHDMELVEWLDKRNYDEA